MSRLAKWCVAMIMTVGMPLAAQVVISGQVNYQGNSVPYAPIQVCAVTSTGTPCTPTAAIYSSYTLSSGSRVSNPNAADANGNYTFYAAALPTPSFYVVQVTPIYGTTWSYVVTGYAGFVTLPVSIANGGTGAMTGAQALVNLGTEQIAQGGTGATTALGGLQNLLAGIGSTTTGTGSGNTTTFPGTVAAPTTNGTINAAMYASGSSTGGIAEAYAACPSTGCHIALGANITISSPQTITVINGKPLTLSNNGFVIYATNTTGTALTLTSNYTNGMIRWDDLLMDGTGAATGTTGLSITNSQAISIHGLIQNFKASGSRGYSLSAVEDSDIGVVLQSDFNGLSITAATNNNKFWTIINGGGSYAQTGTCTSSQNLAGIAISIAGSSNNEFHGLAQSNCGTVTVLVGADTGRNVFDSFWFENNGDTTVNSRLFSLASSAGHYIINDAIRDSTIIGGSWGNLGSIFTSSYPGTIVFFLMENSNSSDYASFADSTFTGTTLFAGINENDSIAGASTYYGLNCSHQNCLITNLSSFGPLSLTGALNTTANITQTGGVGITAGAAGFTTTGGAGYNVPGWVTYEGGGNYYVRDTVNGVMQLLCAPGSGTSGSCQIGGSFSAAAAASWGGGTSISSSSKLPQIAGTPVAGQSLCTYSVGPPIVAGHCTSTVGSTGACTCAQ